MHLCQACLSNLPLFGFMRISDVFWAVGALICCNPEPPNGSSLPQVRMPSMCHWFEIFPKRVLSDFTLIKVGKNLPNPQLSPTMPTDHVPTGHISMALEHLQWWGFHHLSEHLLVPDPIFHQIRFFPSLLMQQCVGHYLNACVLWSKRDWLILPDLHRTTDQRNFVQLIPPPGLEFLWCWLNR